MGYYEHSLMEVAEDLHERYAQLLTSVLAYMEMDESKQEEAERVVRYVISDMRNRSTEIFPHVSYHKETYLHVAAFLQVLEKKHGVLVSYKGEKLLPLSEMKSFRQLQRVVTKMFDYNVQAIDVMVLEGEWSVRFSLEEEFVPCLLNGTDIKASVDVQAKEVMWHWGREETRDDPNHHCR
ncbi:hypothetical protein [Halobacillus salinus]|uniref:Uncharacterized protein n=1 Tax=Halobacillus salinus TaxID=192814 RepID=A0A4Z0H1W3_9BACI|nr:hypothetical protein [Halobacillus salinus]TGB02851.1 hypothetical protein E4663_11915 [Halobacillus salinus]